MMVLFGRSAMAVVVFIVIIKECFRPYRNPVEHLLNELYQSVPLSVYKHETARDSLRDFNVI
jgi:hypothetical protein